MPARDPRGLNGDYQLGPPVVALELGGAPEDLANPWPGAANPHMKDAAETFLDHEICRGALQLADAERQIATNSLSVYRTRGLRPSP